jgi:DNA-binding beta-propeller fold protein YncE
MRSVRCAAALLAAVTSTAVVAGCTASADAVSPPNDQIFFPTGLAVAPDDTVMFVASSNSDLTFDSGTVAVVDLAVVDQVVDAWLTAQTIPNNCEQDTKLTESLICDEAQFIQRDNGVRIGNFATSLAVQQRGSDALRLIVPTRGDPSVTWIDRNAGSAKLDCTGAQGFAICDDAHRLTQVRNDPNLAALDPEPFDAFADSTNQFAMVTHLSTGRVTLIESPADGSAIIADVSTGLFAPDPLTGLQGATAIAGRSPGSADDIVYVTSRSENRVQMLTVGHPVNNDFPFVVPGNYFFLDSVGSNAGASQDTRAMMFSPDGNTMYIANRTPPTLQVFDTSAAATGFPANNLLTATAICQQVSTAALVEASDGPRVYLACFQDGEVYVVDPAGEATVAAIVTAEGAGPFSIASAPTRNKVYVTNFLEDTIGVIDAAPGSPTRDRVVLRIGIPKTAQQTTGQHGL